MQLYYTIQYHREIFSANIIYSKYNEDFMKLWWVIPLQLNVVYNPINHEHKWHFLFNPFGQMLFIRPIIHIDNEPLSGLYFKVRWEGVTQFYNEGQRGGNEGQN